MSPAGVTVSVERQPGAVPAYAIAADHPAVRAAHSALHTVYRDREPLLVRIGGTLPAAVLFERVLGLKTLLFSFSTADENLHAPNEFFRLERLDEGVAAWTELWRLLGGLIRFRRARASASATHRAPAARQSERRPTERPTRLRVDRRHLVGEQPRPPPADRDLGTEDRRLGVRRRRNDDDRRQPGDLVGLDDHGRAPATLLTPRRRREAGEARPTSPR